VETLEPDGVVDDDSGLTVEDVNIVAALLEVTLIMPPRLKMIR
jgi:hypothetical protein